MAFVVRTDRNTLPLSESTTVGPGSYKSASSIKSGKPLFTPFSSSTARLLSASRHGNPGVESYTPTIADNSTPVVSSFKSTIPRFKSDKRDEYSLILGPGKYEAKSEFNIEKKINRSASAGNIIWKKNFTVPSIPAPTQNLGYTEDEHGKLIPQVVISNNSNISKIEPKKHVGTSLFSKSRVARIESAIRDIENTSPIQVSDNNYTFDPPSPKKSAVFSSVVPRDSLISGNLDVPGPGQYEPFTEKFCRPHTSAAFGSSTEREFSIKPQEVSLNTNPTYDASKFLLNNKKGSNKSFLTTARRFTGKIEVTDVLSNPPNFMDESNHKVVGRYGAFGSNDRRFSSKKVEKTPAVGMYSPQQSDCVPKSYQVYGTASFAGNAQRSKINAPVSPGVGAYNIESQWSPPARYGVQKESFLTTTKRFSDKEVLSLGPGSYDSNKPLSAQPVTAVSAFASKFDRFKKKIDRSLPGPGQYSPRKNNADWVKPSFNSTIGDYNTYNSR